MANGFRARTSRGRGLFWALFVLALLLRLANAHWGSFKLDDFHSLHHARAPDARTFLAVLEQDNHPPLSFLLVALSRALFGESPWALRLPALLAGLGTLPLVWRLAARLDGLRVQALATFLVATSSLHVECSSDVRMYALLGLASAGLLEAALAALEDGRGAWRIALWTFVGLHAHYHFLYVLAALGSALLALVTLDPRYRPARRRTLGAFAVAGILSAPWYLGAFPHQLAHGLAPGGSNATLARLGEGLKNLVFLNVSVAGNWSRWSGLLASALFLALAAVALLRCLARLRRSGQAVHVLLASAAFLVPLLTYLAARLSQRAGFEWRYLAGVVPAFCLLVAGELEAGGPLLRTRRAALAFLALAALQNAYLNARDPGEEDYRDAIAWIVARAGPEDGLVAADWQPILFPHSLAWNYYAPRLAEGRALPTPSPHNADFQLLELEDLTTRPRVFCCLRSLPAHSKILLALRARFPEEETLVFGRSIYVHVFTRPR